MCNIEVHLSEVMTNVHLTEATSRQNKHLVAYMYWSFIPNNTNYLYKISFVIKIIAETMFSLPFLRDKLQSISRQTSVIISF